GIVHGRSPYSDRVKATQPAKVFVGTLATRFLVGNRELYMMASVGISVIPEGGNDAESLQLTADLAMYRAKSRKTGFAVFEREFNRRSHERFELANALRTALALNQFEVYYQPLVRLDDQWLIGVEALLRWYHPRLGRIPPHQFIPVAEETGLILEIGEWVLRTACLQGVRWLQEGFPPVRIAVNVSAVQFENPDFEETVARCLETTGFPAGLLELELTERVVMSTPETSAVQMKRLRALGLSIAIDDFGTGYSSLSYLARLPINILKVDRSFVTGLSETSANYLIVKAIMGLAEGLQLLTVAEGIETRAELDLLRDLGCHRGQGYLFARPSSARAISAMFRMP
ncbi:EAL domain-containing protein, partial [Deinococcus sp. Arct2-2]|uniref:putative bifunctional diguanylate cyclase/phosphodiesterase n=1 Tax=Deinococcus sp. Arct2-2 TaxID=2568653 RepID=UPI0010A4DFFF